MVNTVTEFVLAGRCPNNQRESFTLERKAFRTIGANGVFARRLPRVLKKPLVWLWRPALRRHDLQLRLEGWKPRCKLTVSWSRRASSHYDKPTSIEHIAGQLPTVEELSQHRCGQFSWRFSMGRIHLFIRMPRNPNANMRTRNRCSQPDAEIDTKPELEIYATR